MEGTMDNSEIIVRIGLTDPQTAIVMSALSWYMYNNPHINEEQWEIANSVMEKIDEEL
jgi:hypothetical protein